MPLHFCPVFFCVNPQFLSLAQNLPEESGHSRPANFSVVCSGGPSRAAELSGWNPAQVAFQKQPNFDLTC